MTNTTARYNGEFIVIKRTLIIALESENLTIQSVSFFLVDDQKHIQKVEISFHKPE